MRPGQLFRAKRVRTPRGASLGLVAAVAFLIIIVIVAGFQAMIYLGGSRELRHSVDAAVLNLSKRVAENKIPCGIQTGFDDVADASGQVGLTNINRVWGKAYLVNANEEEMEKKGLSTGASNSNATTCFSQARTLNDGVYNLLTSKSNSDAYFTQIAKNKPAKLLEKGNEIYTDKSSKWAYGWIYRGEESNLSVDTGAIPTGVTPKYLNATSGTTYLQGFNPMLAGGKTFCFTTFHANEPPHLVTDSAFSQAKTAVSGAVNPIPNTFQEQGQIKNTQVPMSALACAVANPMRGYKLAIPHAYVTIDIRNTANWLVQGSQYASTVYYPGEGTVWKVQSYKIKKPGKGIENGYVSLGNEYSPANLYWAINNALPGDHTLAFSTLLQRIKEFCPNYTEGQLQALLTGMPYNSGDTTWYIYPTYTQPDLTDPRAAIVSARGSTPPWLVPTAPEGSSQQLITENPVTNGPNNCWSDIRQGPYKTDRHFTEETGQITWEPGTGFVQNLGQLSIKRNVTVTFTALP